MRDLTCPSLSPTLCLLSSYLPGCYLDLNHYWKSTIIIWDSIAWTDRSSRKKYDATMKITTNIYIRNKFCKIKHISSWIIRHISFWKESNYAMLNKPWQSTQRRLRHEAIFCTNDSKFTSSLQHLILSINPVLTGVRHAPSYYKNRTIFLQTHSHVVETFLIDVLGVSWYVTSCVKK